VSHFVTAWRVAAAAALIGVLSPPRMAPAQQRDSTAQPRDSFKVYTLPPAVVSVSRAELPLSKIPFAVQSLHKVDISRARATWGLDEALSGVPGVYDANRYNFSVDQRISIRGFGARSAFSVRGIKVLLDGIPQTLPDGQSQLTNLELGAVERIDVLRGSSSALYGNASGGVISIWTDRAVPKGVVEEVRVVGGTFDRDFDRNWTKWQSLTQFRVGHGSASILLSRLRYAGERDHSDADLRNYNFGYATPVGSWLDVRAHFNWGDQPRADNPGALTYAELVANRNQAAPRNLQLNAGKDVTQRQVGATFRARSQGNGEAQFSFFGLTRDLENPLPQAYITIDRGAYGFRGSASRLFRVAGRDASATVGVDVQWQRDDRVEYANVGGRPDLTSVQRNQVERVNEIGPFFQGTVGLVPKVDVTLGVRYDAVKFRVDDRLATPGASGGRLMDALSGAVGISVNPVRSLTTYANVSSSFETPTTTELINRVDSVGAFNGSLKPQRAVGFEVGGRGVVNGRASWNLALFWSNVSDELIPYEIPTSPGRNYFRNAASARHRGLELGTDVEIASGLNALASWTYADFRYTDYKIGATNLEGRAIPGIPQHWLRLLVKARPSLARGAWVDVEVSHSSGSVVHDTSTAARPTDPWTVLNLRLGWEGTAGGVRLSPFVAFNNVFNLHYVGSVVINAFGGRYYEPAPGRNLYLGFTVGAGR